MHAMVAIAVYTPFAVITAVVFIIELFRGFKRHEDYLFTLLCLCIALWFASDISSLLTNDYDTFRFMYNFKLIFVGLVPPVLLLFVLRFYKVQMGKHERSVMWLLFTIPALNVPVVLSSTMHSLMVDIEMISMAPYLEFSIIWGPWFWVHTIQSYIVSFLIISVVIIRHFRMPRFYRMPSTLMSVGILITLIGNIITLMQLFPPLIDPTLITCSLSMILFDLAIINNNKSKFVHFSHNRIHHYLDEYILILDETQRVLEWNQPAEEWFAEQGIGLKDTVFPGVINALLAKEGASQKESEDGRGTNIYLLGSDFPMVLNLRLHKITDVHEDVIGYIAVFSDITQTWALIEKLEEKAGVDSLTGIPNHMAYIGAKARLDVEEYLPLSVVMCDANGLKQTNDTLGHQYGDLLIKVVAEVLETACAKTHFVARTGGDEFVCLLSNTSSKVALEKIAEIQQTLQELKQYPFPVSVAMGVATKYSVEEDIEEVIAKADSRMYQNKRLMKEQLLVKEEFAPQQMRSSS